MRALRDDPFARVDLGLKSFQQDRFFGKDVAAAIGQLDPAFGLGGGEVYETAILKNCHSPSGMFYLGILVRSAATLIKINETLDYSVNLIATQEEHHA